MGNRKSPLPKRKRRPTRSAALVIEDECVLDDSTACWCSRCMAAEDRFWREQGEQQGELDADREEQP